MTDSIYWLVFFSGLLSSTLLPGNSEAVFSIALINNPALSIPLLFFVTVGNTVGGLISWGMGRAIAIRYSAEQLAKPGHQNAVNTIQQWGAPSLLLSWIPLIGDPLCVAAGWLKVSLVQSILFIAAGKFFRYALLVWFID